MPSNVAYTAAALRLAGDEWNYNAPVPQAAAFKGWLKSHLAQGHPVAFFPMCQGDAHACYPGSCPPNNGTGESGAVDHVEPVFGVYSNYPLDDATVYDDDVVVHMSDQDRQPYYRTLASLDDTPAMAGNCAAAQPGFGKNEMYPCFDAAVTYGFAVAGVAVAADAAGLPQLAHVSLVVNTTSEPDVRRGDPPVGLRGDVEVAVPAALVPGGAAVALYRYTGTANLPADAAGVAASSNNNSSNTGGSNSGGNGGCDPGFPVALASLPGDAFVRFHDTALFDSSAAVYYVALAQAAAHL
jgi:hypothetical protein